MHSVFIEAVPRSGTVGEINMSKIAIIVPVYNVEKYVTECLQSILDQHYQDWECFVVNDGSTDGSGAIIDLFAKQDPRFRVFHKKNGGVSLARNFALDIIEKEKKRFDFIHFVDSDDRTEPNLYTELTQIIKADNSDIAVCGCYHFDTLGKRIRGQITSPEAITNEEFVELVFSFGKWSSRLGRGGQPWNKLFRAETIAGIRFINNRDIIEDELFCIEAATKISVLPECLYGYRLRSNSLLHDSLFVMSHQKCRELCVAIASRISDRAYLVTVSAYLQTVLSNSKSKGSFMGVNGDVISPEILDKLLGSGLAPKKTVFLYRMFADYPTISKIYLKIRAIFNALSGRRKRKQKGFYD